MKEITLLKKKTRFMKENNEMSDYILIMTKKNYHSSLTNKGLKQRKEATWVSFFEIFFKNNYMNRKNN